MVLISDIYITIPLEIIFFYLFYKCYKYSAKSVYVLIINLAFLLVNLLVLLTVFISDLDLQLSTKSWWLGFFTGLSYLILPWLFYWFIANYENYMNDPSKLQITGFQKGTLIATAFVGFIPLAFPDLIGYAITDQYSIPNWTYDWKLEVGQFMLWLLFLVLYVIAQDNLNRSKVKAEDNKKFIRKITITALIVFSTPVFFVISPGFILLSLVIYVLAYYVVCDGLMKFY